MIPSQSLVMMNFHRRWKTLSCTTSYAKPAATVQFGWCYVNHELHRKSTQIDVNLHSKCVLG